MNWDTSKASGTSLRGACAKKWGDLTDDELTEMAGKKDRLAGKLQEKYGWTRRRRNAKSTTSFAIKADPVRFCDKLSAIGPPETNQWTNRSGGRFSIKCKGQACSG